MDWGTKMRVVFLFTGAFAALSLAACDAGPSAKAPSAPPAAASGGVAPAMVQASASPTVSTPAGGEEQSATLQVATPLVDGKPMWAANRKYSAEDNASYQFGKNGADFGAASEAAYVAKVHAFVESPPAGVQRLTRSNGDVLLYDPKSNTFAVVTKDGAPRTMFKPDGGAAYWSQQVSRESAGAKGGGDSSQG
jgi:pyocin large subunit-like protein